MKAETIKVRVCRKCAEAEDICAFELEAVSGEPLPSFAAGAHVDVHLPNGLVRQYSLCNDAATTTRYQIAVLREPNSRGGSRAMHLLAQGDTLEISAPKNHFPLAPDAGRHLLLAGGIGITPILCMAERLEQIGGNFELHYSTRAPERTAFRERILQSGFAHRCAFYFDNADPPQRFDLDGRLASRHPGEHLYVCGPKGYMNAMLNAAREHGWPEDSLHYEFFSGAPVKSESDGSFEVMLASSGKLVKVGADQTVIQALAAAGVEVPYSCEQGVCGTCAVRVLDGQPDHRDMYLSPEEHARNDQFTPCCSRSKSARLVLDL